jgi:hypothetical protein
MDFFDCSWRARRRSRVPQGSELGAIAVRFLKAIRVRCFPAEENKLVVIYLSPVSARMTTMIFPTFDDSFFARKTARA